MSEQESGPTRPSTLAAYADLFERLRDSAFLIDPDSYQILDSNTASERSLGTSAEEFRKSTLLDWISPKEREEVAKGLRIARRRYYPRTFDTSWRTKTDQVVVMEMSVCALRLSVEKDVIQVIAKDVTKIRETEAKAEQYLKELKALNNKLETMSITDEMTGLSNFRHFSSELKKEHERASRYQTLYSIIFIDADHFKHYNDKNGHPAGDGALRLLASTIKKQCRNTDLPARYGGEEFVVLSPGINSEGARIFAERIRTTIESTKFEFGSTQPLGKVTVSIGISTYPQDGQSADDILEAADGALYQSKANGRNRVTTCGDVKNAVPESKPKAA